MRAWILAASLMVPLVVHCTDDAVEPMADSGPIDAAADAPTDAAADGPMADMAAGCGRFSAELSDYRNYQLLLECLRDSGSDNQDKEQAIGTFVRIVEASGGFPIVDGSKVVFVYIRKAAFDLEDDQLAEEDFAPATRVEPIRVCGSFNDWDPDQHTLTHEGDEFFHGEITLDTTGGQRMAYKLVAKNASGVDVWFSDPLSRRFDFDSYGRFSIIRGGEDGNGTAVGHLEQIWRVHATQLDDDRSIFLYLPRRYDQEPSKSYPVLYMHDGWMLFDPLQPFSGDKGCWEVDRVVEAEISANQIEELIVVGIPHGVDRRIDEYTHTEDYIASIGPAVGGRGEAYLDFVVNDLKPIVDARYRTRAGREDTAILGASLGGLISYYAGLKHPTVFKYIGGMSTTFGWGQFHLDNPTMEALYQQDADLASYNQVYYLDSGDDPDNPTNPPSCPLSSPPGEDNYCETVAFREMLVGRGIDTFPSDPNSFPLGPAGINIYHHHEPDAPHDEAAWRARLFRPLRLFFPR